MLEETSETNLNVTELSSKSLILIKGSKTSKLNIILETQQPQAATFSTLFSV